MSRRRDIELFVASVHENIADDHKVQRTIPFYLKIADDLGNEFFRPANRAIAYAALKRGCRVWLCESSRKAAPAKPRPRRRARSGVYSTSKLAPPRPRSSAREAAPAIHLGHALNKERRFWEYAHGNRNSWTAAVVYWRMIGGWDRQSQEYCGRHAREKCRREADHIYKRTSRVVTSLKNKCFRRAAIVCSTCPQTRDRHQNVARVLGMALAYAEQNGLCSASKSSIAQALGLSRKTVHKWIRLLESLGMLVRIGYDLRGHVSWRGRKISIWCVVYQVALPSPLAHPRL